VSAVVSDVFCKIIPPRTWHTARKTYANLVFGAVLYLKIRYIFWIGQHVGYRNVEPDQSCPDQKRWRAVATS
jgi:hypothetical protein